ncbi:putative NAD-dependent epimerase/dehydratase [Lasiosphaeria miniovina]|uniref:NAD-dependent epimerase/dehydratase n=1 Tax=Lasiosphaeria miniovina TaxID=1954250 RepID=A0AA40EE65_9PEZI|nr:putative NAD-dependent epimerase/dehydratase [Lasiosphaeria miniovina]KAK0735112.1 putative NAD-dependent epimerase/dehydratase [Lasiosphaeria miniovina]
MDHPTTAHLAATAPANTYAVLGSTGNCGTALIENLLNKPGGQVHAYCRNRAKLMRVLPDIKDGGRVTVFEGSVQDVDLLTACIRGCRAVFLVVSTNDNIPGCRLAQDTAAAVLHALRGLRDASPGNPLPKLVLLSSATIDDHFSRHVPWLLRLVLLRSASHVYADLVETERMLRAEAGWLTAIYAKPGALSVDVQRGHALSLTDEDSPLSYLDLAAAMIEAVDDDTGAYDGQNVSVVNTNGRAKFPTGTPMCILMGLMRHYLPFLHPYLPANTGPR